MVKKEINGEFTNCINNVTSIKTIEYRIDNEHSTGCRVLYLVNGVTGYESIPLIDSDRILHLSMFGWLACFGTKNKYDKLFISPNELIKMFVNEGIIIFNLD